MLEPAGTFEDGVLVVLAAGAPDRREVDDHVEASEPPQESDQDRPQRGIGVASGATVSVSSPSAAPPSRRSRRTARTGTSRPRRPRPGRGRTARRTRPGRRPSTLHVGDEHGEEQPEPRLEHHRHPGEQERVRQAPMEDGVAEDRPGVVVETDEGGELEACVMDAEHDAVGERVERKPARIAGSGAGTAGRWRVRGASGRTVRERAGRRRSLGGSIDDGASTDVVTRDLTGRGTRSAASTGIPAIAAIVSKPSAGHEERSGAGRPSESPDRCAARRDVLRLGAVIAAGGGRAPILAARAAGLHASRGGGRAGIGASCPVRSPSSSAAAIRAPSRRAAGLRRLQGPAPRHRVGRPDAPGLAARVGPARARRAGVRRAGGLVMIDGLFSAGWTRDGLLADLGADPAMAEVLARVPDRFHLAGPGETTTRAFPLALSRGVQTTGLYYNKALLDRAGSGPRRRWRTSRRWWSPWRRSAPRRSSTAPATCPSTRCWSRGCCR